MFLRCVHRLGTATILLIIVVCPPLAAGAWIVDHRSSWPTRDQLHALINTPPPAATIIAACITIAAIGWLLLMYHLARQAVRAVRRRHAHRHLRIPTPAQITASSMASFAALTLPGISAGDHPPVPTADTAPEQPASPTPPHHTTIAGTSLPSGGWLPTSTALAVTTTAALIWLRRRQHYQPGPPQPDRSTRDNDLQPLPPTVDAITAAPPRTGQPAIPSSQPLTVTDQPPPGVLRLDGPGAADAARGMIITVALGVATGQPVHPLHLHHDDLTWLLPGTDPRDLSAAEIHPEPAARHAVPSPQAQPTTGPATPRTSAEPHTTIRFSDDPTTTLRWHVARDGVTTGTGITAPHRLCVIDPQAAGDLITLIRQALDHAAPAARHAPTDASTPEPAPTASPGGSLPPAHLRLIGGCALTVAGTVVHLRRKAALQILAYLAIHQSGATKAALIHACWPGHPPSTITQRLHTTISDLRSQLIPLIDTDPIIRDDEHYTLNPQAVDTDLQTWRAAVQAAANATTAEIKIRALRHLIDLHRGDLAAGQPWPWLTPAREAQHRDVIDAYTTAAALAQPSEAAQLLKEAIEIDPHNQQLRRRVQELTSPPTAPA